MIEILVVEDDAHLRKLMVFALGLDSQFSITECGSGESALERVAAHKPDIVLLDLVLPGIGGRETARQLADVDVFVIVVTGLERLPDLGACGVIKKPFDPVNLAAEVRRLHEAR